MQNKLKTGIECGMYLADKQLNEIFQVVEANGLGKYLVLESLETQSQVFIDVKQLKNYIITGRL